MRVPLICYKRLNKLSVYRNGKQEDVAFPFKPYFYAVSPLSIEHCLIQKEKVKLLSTLKDSVLYKHIFDNFDALQHAINQNFDDVVYNETYLHDVLIDRPDFFYGYPQDKPLKIMNLDIEVKTTGSSTFPKPETHRIYCIGVKTYDGMWNETNSIVFDCYHSTEREMLTKFAKFYREYNPDVILGYNIKRFDIPFIATRLEKNHISSSVLQRDTSFSVDLSPLQQSMFKQHKTVYDTKIRLKGRVIYDVYVQAQRDNKLRKLRDYKLQTIADWFGFPSKTLTKDIVTNLARFVNEGNENKVSEYVLHDCELNRLVANVYLAGKILLAEIVGAPLDMVVNDYPTFVPSLIHARPLRKLGFIGDKKNSDRYASMAYQGAFVGLKKAGLFKPLYHVDFSSMYPSIIRSFNLSPETTWIIKTDKKFSNEPSIEDAGEYHILKLPDKAFGGDVWIGILKAEGILPQQLTEMYNKRLEFKKLYRETRDEKANSLQNIYKLILNTSYGYNGSQWAKWGNFPVAVATTGMGRFIIKKVTEWLGDGAIEIDTDGIYADKIVDMSILNKRLSDWIASMGFPSYMELDYDTHDAGYFYKMKNYVILEKGKLQWTGNSFISRRQPRLVQRALEVLIRMKFDGIVGKEARKIVNELYDFSQYNIHDYSMNTRLWNSIDSYKQTQAIARRLAIQARDSFGEDISVRTQFSYVVTKDRREPYKLVDSVKVEDIDRKYYEHELDKVLERVQFSRDASLLEYC